MGSTAAVEGELKQKNVVVLISGSGESCAAGKGDDPVLELKDGGSTTTTGTNLQALIDAQLSDTRFALVVSNRSAAYGLERAKVAGIPTAVMALKPWLTKHPGKTREDYDEELAHLILRETGGAIDLVVLAGWMHVLSNRFLDVFGANPSSEPASTEDEVPELTKSPVPIINLHPALPGTFDGANAIARAHDAFKAGQITKTGAMVHEVIAEVDRGTPIVVREVLMKEGEAVEALEERIHLVEHEIIVEAAVKVLGIQQRER